MSDTPKSDAVKHLYAMHGIDWYELCQELERENTALREAMKELAEAKNINAAVVQSIARIAINGWRKEAQP